jgi:hypothetical protein
MADRHVPDESDEEFQELQCQRLKQIYRHARDDQREYTIERKDQLRMQRYRYVIILFHLYTCSLVIEGNYFNNSYENVPN